MTISTAWTPLQLGDVQLAHRVVLAPLTRNRGTPSTEYPGTYLPNELMTEYYTQRATPGGLLITEALPVSQRASGVPGIPALFTPEQPALWRPLVTSVHGAGGLIFAQLWHQGRTTHSGLAHAVPESASAVALNGEFAWAGFEARPFEVPHAMDADDIARVQDEFVRCARAAREVGFDGVEIHAGNGYLFDQFHHSNINKRTDAYGGSLEARCTFTLETVRKLMAAIGAGRLGVRLTPFGLFNQAEGEQRVEQWTYLCAELAKLGVAYVHLIEPRFDEFKSAAEKAASLSSLSLAPSLAPFRAALGSTPLVSAGGHTPTSLHATLDGGAADAVAFGRYFIANPDLVDRLRTGDRLYKWDRSRFYGPFDDNELGYTVHKAQKWAVEADAAQAQLAD
ncbi:hypothetical protein Q5752_007060 [Cryptotrichosporon argae]